MNEEKPKEANEFDVNACVLASDLKPWKQAKNIIGRGTNAIFVAVVTKKTYDPITCHILCGGRPVIMTLISHSGTTFIYASVNFAAIGRNMIGKMMVDVVIAPNMPWIVDLHFQKHPKLDELISAHWNLEQINAVMESAKTGLAHRNIIILRWQKIGKIQK